MKVLVDFSHLSMRNLFVAISQAKPKIINGMYENSYINFFYHLMLKSLIHIKKKFNVKNKDIYLCIDSRENWRKKIYPEYKANRKDNRDNSKIDFEYFFKKREQFIKVLDECFPYNVIEVDGVEADDIIGVLAKRFKDEILVITSDKDIKQVLLYGSKMYDPIKQEEVNMSIKELIEFKQLHILLGDQSDNIPNVMKGLEYSKEFISFLKQNNIFIFDPNKLEKMEIFEKLKEDFEKQDLGSVYKKTRFGDKTALKFIKENKFEEYKNNPKFLENYERNKKLIDFDYIPKEVESKILDTFNNLEYKKNGDCVFKFITKANLKEIMQNINDLIAE